MGESRIALAAIAGAHGISGEVRLKLFAESVDSLKQHRNLMAGDRVLTLVSAKAGGIGAIARFAEVTDRDQAESLRGTLVTVERTALPALGEGEYYHADLIGLPCVGPAGEPLGTVVAVENFGAGDLLEIERPDGRRAMIPFRAGVADFEGERILADPAFLA